MSLIEMTPEINTQDWQQAFITTNILAIGYNAWVGYLGGERGVVICSTNSPHLSMAGETFKAHFIPRKNLAAFLNAWLAAPDTVLFYSFITQHQRTFVLICKRISVLVGNTH